MVQPASWIKDNMIQQKRSPSKLGISNKQKNYRRPLTEAEIKVKRSLEKLSIPEWYLNNSSKPPKIMMHDTPIDTRLPPWRTGSSKSKNVSSSPILNKRKLSDNASPQKTPIVDDKPVEKRVSKIINRMDTWQIPNPAKTPVKYTRSYPRVSPSRKIENINIVFPPKSPIQLDENENPTRNDPKCVMEKSLIETSFDESALDKSVRVTDLDKLLDLSIEQSFKAIRESKKKNSTAQSTERCATPHFLSPSFMRVQYENKPKCSPVPLSSVIIEEESHVEKESSSVSSPSYSGFRCASCQSPIASPQPIPRPRNLPKTPTFKPRSKLMPIDENREIIHRIDPKSTPERIVKKKVQRGTGLIQDIIEELQKKCAKTPNPTFTGGSKKFVKKLVKILEKSICEDAEEPDPMEKNVHDTSEYRPNSNNSEIDNDFDNKSVASSFKETDVGSCGSEPLSPISSNCPDYNWSMQVQVDIENEVPQPSKKDKIHWIPLRPNIGLPRTSSVFSMESRSSSRSLSNKSPCMSPITEVDRKSRFFGRDRTPWNWSLDANDLNKTRPSFGNEKSYVISDSIYSGKIQRSSLVQSFLSEYEASFTGSDEHDTSAKRRLSFGRAPSILSRSVCV